MEQERCGFTGLRSDGVRAPSGIWWRTVVDPRVKIEDECGRIGTTSSYDILTFYMENSVMSEMRKREPTKCSFRAYIFQSWLSTGSSSAYT